MSDLPNPTPDLKPLAVALGLDGLLRLLEARAGTRLPIPKKVGQSKLVEELGLDLTAALVDAWGGAQLKVPLGREWRAQVYRARGQSYAEIARRLGLTERGVWGILSASGLIGGGPSTAAPRAPSHQLDLFDL